MDLLKKLLGMIEELMQAVEKYNKGVEEWEEFYTKIANLYLDRFKDANISDKYFNSFQDEEQSFIGKLFLELLTFSFV